MPLLVLSEVAQTNKLLYNLLVWVTPLNTNKGEKSLSLFHKKIVPLD
jgi:hypothetical protein